MKIGVFDDEPMWSEKIAECIKQYFWRRDINEYEIFTISTVEELFRIMDSIDILFLDVELSEDYNGFDVAKTIQERYGACVICFLTSHIEFARQGYVVNAYRYIDKLHLEEIDEALGSYINNIAKVEYLECKTVEGLGLRINLCDVVYVEKLNRKICLHMSDGGEYFSDGNLKDLAEKYKDSGLVQIQRSYLVNLKHIKSYDSRSVKMIDDVALAIGRDKLKDFKRDYFGWRRNTEN